jgi:hypothetical protein
MHHLLSIVSRAKVVASSMLRAQYVESRFAELPEVHSERNSLLWKYLSLELSRSLPLASLSISMLSSPFTV